MRPPPSLAVFPASVKQWYNKTALEAEGTAKNYLSNLGNYWSNSLKARGYATIDDWVQEVKEEQRSDNIETRRKWGADLEAFVNSYISAKTGKPLVKGSKNVTVMAVTSFLKHCLGDRLESYDFALGTKQERMAEAREKESVEPVTIDEIKAVYKEAQSKRDRAIISTLVSGGCGVGEWNQFAQEWFRYVNDIRNGTAPIKVNVTRPKTMQSYTHFLWDDAVEDLHDLLVERERDLGRPLGKDDPLFTNQSGKPIKIRDVQKVVRRLADRSGVEPLDKNKVSYRVRPHEIGKDFFRTQLALARVPNDVAEYLSGHVVDSNQYNKFHRTKEGQELILREASALRPLLNIRTAKGQSQTEDEAELELLAKYAKAFLPKAYTEFKQRFPTVRALSGKDVKEALDFVKGLIQPAKANLAPTVRSSNHEYDYIRTPVESDDYMQALADGYEDFSSNGSNVHVLRRKKD